MPRGHHWALDMRDRIRQFEEIIIKHGGEWDIKKLMARTVLSMGISKRALQQYWEVLFDDGRVEIDEKTGKVIHLIFNKDGTLKSELERKANLTTEEDEEKVMQIFKTATGKT